MINFIDNNIAPYLASQIGVYNSNGTRIGALALNNFKPEFSERLYRFGVLSDVHNESNQADENQGDIINALNYFNQKEDIEFTVITGDLTQYSYSNGNLSTELSMYQQNLASINNSTPVYPTTGNHDCPQSSDIDINTWKSLTGTSSLYTSEAIYSYEVTKTHQTSSGNTVNDHFLFLGMRRYQFTSTTYLDSDITWLSNKLESYKNDRCFILTHMFFPDAAGNFQQIYPSGNWLSGNQLATLQNLRNNYPRSIWFSGHSHWKWYLQEAESKANVYPISNKGRTMGWTVHIPSCATPIDSNVVNTSLSSNRVAMAGESEGAIVDVYEDYIDIRAVQFKGSNDSNYNTKYIPIAQYRLYTAPETSGGETGNGTTVPNDGYVYPTQTMISANPQKIAPTTMTIDENSHDVTVTFNAASSGALITDGTLTNGSSVQILHDGIVWGTYEPSGTALTKIGIYDGSGYTLTSGITATIDSAAGIQINTSSSYITNGGSVPVTLTLRNFRFKKI